MQYYRCFDSFCIQYRLKIKGFVFTRAHSLQVLSPNNCLHCSNFVQTDYAAELKTEISPEGHGCGFVLRSLPGSLACNSAMLHSDKYTNRLQTHESEEKRKWDENKSTTRRNRRQNQIIELSST